MRAKFATSGERLGVLLGVVSLAVMFAVPASAAGGHSTPGATVVAVNPGTSTSGSDLRITLTGHAERSTVVTPSCRPQDLSLDCWGSLVLRVPDAGGLTVSHFVVHRVAVGDISCEDDEDGDCGDHEMSESAVGAGEEAVQAHVNGVALLRNPGNTGLPAGTKVQLKFTLTDAGPEPFGDHVDVQINEFVPGPVKPLLYSSGPETIQQVQIHLRAADS